MVIKFEYYWLLLTKILIACNEPRYVMTYDMQITSLNYLFVHIYYDVMRPFPHAALYRGMNTIATHLL